MEEKKSSLQYIFLICAFDAGSIMLKSLIRGPGFPQGVSATLQVVFNMEES